MLISGSDLEVLPFFAHPMIPEHFIQWIYVETENGGQRKALKPEQAPKATFCVGDEKVVAVYEYCNLHGLWMTEV